MAESFSQEIGVFQDGLTVQIPMFYKLMASMLTVAVIPIFLLGIVSAGDTGSIVATLGLQNSIIVMTLLTVFVVFMWSFFLAKSITDPVEQLSQAATSASQGDLANVEITVTSNDEIGELAVAFNRLINSYRILDTLAKDDAE
ncbi:MULTISPECIES: HAMP domain-containing protein [Methanoculleus]|uniref:histidine kinase n=1 Tax=Methanoculleus submarinus TaxID=204050 RepID=A0AAX3E947_9EURY|nr:MULTISPECIES: HAMP domain-containing protein [Methanoculleus]MCC7556697.1 HAMP domain-containing protein [Methanoculleus marisnigri]UYU18605.1 HAMP domain-containing protein [Methanoculleus submarinus]